MHIAATALLGGRSCTGRLTRALCRLMHFLLLSLSLEIADKGPGRRRNCIINSLNLLTEQVLQVLIIG